MNRTAREARNMGREVQRSSRGFQALGAVGGRLKNQITGVVGVLGKAAATLGAVASAGLTAGPALVAAGAAVFEVAKASGQAAPALLAIAAAGAFVKLTMAQLAPAIGKALTPITSAFQKAGAAAGDLAAKGVRPLAAEFAKVGMPVVAQAMNRIAVSTNKVVKGFLGWANSAPGIQALRNFTTSTALAFEKVAPAAQRLGIALAAMIGRISGVSLAAGSKGLTGVLDFLTDKLNGINEKTVSAGLDKLRSTFDSIRDAVVRVRDVVAIAMGIFRQYRTEILILADVFGVLAIVFGGPVAAILAAVGLVIRHMDFVKAAVQRVKTQFASPGSTAFFDNIRSAVAVLWPAVKSAFDQIKAAVVPVVTEIWTKIRTQLIPALGEFIAAAAPVVAFFIKNFVPIIVNAFRTVGQVISAAVTIITGILQVFTGILRGDWSKVWEGIKNITRGAVGLVKAVISGALNAIKGYFRLAAATVRGIWNGLLNLIKSAASSAWRTVLGGVASLVVSVAGKFSEMRAAVVSRISSLVSAVKGAASRVKSAFSNINLFSAGANIIQSLLNGITSKAGAVIDKISSIAGSIRDHFPFSPAKRGPLKTKPMSKAGRNIVRDLARGMTTGTQVRSAVRGVAATVTGIDRASVGSSANSRGAAGVTVINNFNGIVGDPAEVGRMSLKAVNGYLKLNGRPGVA